jgi:hypothetical protein
MFFVFRSDRKERKKGGVMTLVRNNINARETKQYLEEAEYLEMLQFFSLVRYPFCIPVHDVNDWLFFLL